jgi:hypothetical protein
MSAKERDATKRRPQRQAPDAGKAADEDYAEQVVEKAVESTSAANTADKADAEKQLTGDGKARS